MPLRDDRRGNRATLAGCDAPLVPDFRALAPKQTAREARPDPAAAVAAFYAEWSARVRALALAIWNFFEVPERGVSQPQAAPTSDDHILVARSFAEELASLLPVAERAADSPQAEIPAPQTEAEEAGLDPIVVAFAPRPAFERVVPLTRTPLRPHSVSITWPRLTNAASELESPLERHAFLRDVPRAVDASLATALQTAYREEEGEGRLLALRALRRGNVVAARDTFVDALAVGTDDERSVAVDALLAFGEREAVTSAFSDRIDAIAAQAALGYVATNSRGDYFAALEPFVDRPRIETILGLLAGVVE